MGYKLAGYEHLGGVEINPKVAEIYKENLQPKYLFVDDIREFNKREDLPKELYELDILDGSPPCTSFSMQGVREKGWGKKKKFDEGAKLQTLDDLVFVYCDTIAKLKPKVCLLENVEGLIKGNAKVYAKAIKKRIENAGYNVQIFLLNSKYMGVPQERRRVFFIGFRKELNFKPLKLEFEEKPILFGEVADFRGRPITGPDTLRLWKQRKPTDRKLADIKVRLGEKNSRYSSRIVAEDRVFPTTTTMDMHYSKPLHISESEAMKVATFPIDYKAEGNIVSHLTGMYVPPIMTAQIASQIYEQWLSKIKENG